MDFTHYFYAIQNQIPSYEFCANTYYPQFGTNEYIPYTDNQGIRLPERNCESVEEQALPLPKELTDMFGMGECKLCGVAIPSESLALTHYEGKHHIKNVKAFMRNNYNMHGDVEIAEEKFQRVTCEVCHVTLTSKVVYLQHFSGKQHLKNLKKNMYLSSNMVVSNPDEIASLSQLPPPPPPPQLSDFVCQICNISTNTEKQLILHRNGQKHQKRLAKLREHQMDYVLDGIENNYCSTEEFTHDFENDITMDFPLQFKKTEIEDTILEAADSTQDLSENSYDNRTNEEDLSKSEPVEEEKLRSFCFAKVNLNKVKLDSKVKSSKLLSSTGIVLQCLSQVVKDESMKNKACVGNEGRDGANEEEGNTVAGEHGNTNGSAEGDTMLSKTDNKTEDESAKSDGDLEPDEKEGASEKLESVDDRNMPAKACHNVRGSSMSPLTNRKVTDESESSKLSKIDKGKEENKSQQLKKNEREEKSNSEAKCSKLFKSDEDKGGKKSLKKNKKEKESKSNETPPKLAFKKVKTNLSTDNTLEKMEQTKKKKIVQKAKESTTKKDEFTYDHAGLRLRTDVNEQWKTTQNKQSSDDGDNHTYYKSEMGYHNFQKFRRYPLVYNNKYSRYYKISNRKNFYQWRYEHGYYRERREKFNRNSYYGDRTKHDHYKSDYGRKRKYGHASGSEERHGYSSRSRERSYSSDSTVSSRSRSKSSSRSRSSSRSSSSDHKSKYNKRSRSVNYGKVNNSDKYKNKKQRRERSSSTSSVNRKGQKSDERNKKEERITAKNNSRIDDENKRNKRDQRRLHEVESSGDKDNSRVVENSDKRKNNELNLTKNSGEHRSSSRSSTSSDKDKTMDESKICEKVHKCKKSRLRCPYKHVKREKDAEEEKKDGDSNVERSSKIMEPCEKIKKEVTHKSIVDPELMAYSTSSGSYYCKYCVVSTKSVQALRDHLSSPKHAIMVKVRKKAR